MAKKKNKQLNQTTINIIKRVKNGLRETKDSIYHCEIESKFAEITSNLGYHIEYIHYFCSRKAYPISEFYKKLWSDEFKNSGPVILFKYDDLIENLNTINCITQNKYKYKAVFTFDNIDIVEKLNNNEYIGICNIIPWRRFE